MNFAIQKGLQSSRAELVYFKHNYPDDLERLILEREKNLSVSNGCLNMYVEEIHYV